MREAKQRLANGQHFSHKLSSDVADLKTILEHTKFALAAKIIDAHVDSIAEAEQFLSDHSRSMRPLTKSERQSSNKDRIAAQRLRKTIVSLDKRIADPSQYEKRNAEKTRLRKRKAIRDIQEKTKKIKSILSSPDYIADDDLRTQGNALVEKAKRLVSNLQSQLGLNDNAQPTSEEEQSQTKCASDSKDDDYYNDIEQALPRSASPCLSKTQSFTSMTIWKDALARDTSQRKSKTEWYTSEGDFGLEHLL
ncbi:hypothetical protein LTS08_004848 [Lithohypha guttulata]|uniref:Uncharacterized protein n=1 Tax=Lithohypha guttulata TaxID=1690604 RepID=A0AAN7Y7M6_9EURO|nr:hypothetical protein LTR05_002309 [Lithohypha guttulata]KAK5101241.1 hypothetical protein LTS08_004848 [Lithohypha guttulata]